LIFELDKSEIVEIVEKVIFSPKSIEIFKNKIIICTRIISKRIIDRHFKCNDLFGIVTNWTVRWNGVRADRILPGLNKLLNNFSAVFPKLLRNTSHKIHRRLDRTSKSGGDRAPNKQQYRVWLQISKRDVSCTKQICNDRPVYRPNPNRAFNRLISPPTVKTVRSRRTDDRPFLYFFCTESLRPVA